MDFEITIPVLNEEATLEKQVLVLQDFLLAHFPMEDNWQIVIADNGSTDATRHIAEDLSAAYPAIQLVRVPERGVGRALKASWGQSTADIVGYMDLDLATDLKHFPEAIRSIRKEGCDLVYGTRLHPRSRVINRPLKREISSRGFNLILKWYLGVEFSDGMCGFKFLKRPVFERLFAAGARNDGWFFSTELLVIGEWLNLQICELPVTWTDDPSSSKVKILPLAKKYLWAMHALKKRKSILLKEQAT